MNIVISVPKLESKYFKKQIYYHKYYLSNMMARISFILVYKMFGKKNFKRKD